MRNLILAAATFFAATAGHAATLASNDFDAENGGVTALNYTGYSNLTVTNGSTDLVANADYGIFCAGSKGACVDLDGTTNSGGQLNTATFAFAANRAYTLSFDLSGNQRGFGDDTFYAGVNFDGNHVLNYYSLGGGFGSAQIFQGFTSSGVLTSSSVSDSSPFTTYTIGFSAQTAGTFYFYVGTSSSDNVGPILDNLVVASDVPEPATWGLMIAGFGLVGTTLRRRSAAAA